MQPEFSWKYDNIKHLLFNLRINKRTLCLSFSDNTRQKHSVFNLICTPPQRDGDGLMHIPSGRKHVNRQRRWQIRKRRSIIGDADLFADKHIGVDRVIATLFTFRLHGFADALSHGREFPNRVISARNARGARRFFVWERRCDTSVPLMELSMELSGSEDYCDCDTWIRLRHRFGRFGISLKLRLMFGNVFQVYLVKIKL